MGLVERRLAWPGLSLGAIRDSVGRRNAETGIAVRVGHRGETERTILACVINHFRQRSL
jgi:hypothetical protein